MNHKPKVLFFSTGNATRSRMAAAFLRPVCSSAIHSVLDAVIAAAALGLLTFVKARPWMVVLATVLVSVLLMR